jgi:hypothetical protein
MDDARSSMVSAEFARWYRTVDFGDDTERYQRRQTGLLNLAHQAEEADIPGLVKLAFRAKQPPSKLELDKILKPFRDADTAFDAGSNGRELQILAGATLHAMMIDGGTTGGIAALAATTAGLNGARRPELPIDLISAAEAALGTIADQMRERQDIASTLNVPAVNFDKATAKARENSWESVAQAFGLAASAAQEAMAALVNRIAAALNDANTVIGIQDEELDMLWWLVGERSWDQDRAFSDVAPRARPLTFGKELASLTKFPPGPRSVKSLLSRAGLKEADRLSVPAVVNACGTEWLRPLVSEKEPSPVIHPIHFAIKRKLETGEDQVWVNNWAAVAGVSAGHEIGALMLGTLFYRERLLSPFFEM